MIGGAELSWDAVHGVPLRAAIYSSTSSSPVIELAASEISYGPVAGSTFEFTPPAGAKIDEIKPPDSAAKPSEAHDGLGQPAQAHNPRPGDQRGRRARKPGSTGWPRVLVGSPEGLPKVKINGVSATELSTALGTLLSFERSGVHYVLVGSVTPTASRPSKG